MKIEKNIITTGEAFLDCLKANSTSLNELKSIFDDILTGVENATTNDSDSEQRADAVENAIIDFVSECCGYMILSDEVKEFCGFDDDKTYFLDE